MPEAALVRRSDGGEVAIHAADDLFNPKHAGAMMFFLFSNKLGCLGSLLISGILTLILLALLGVINFGGGGW